MRSPWGHLVFCWGADSGISQWGKSFNLPRPHFLLSATCSSCPSLTPLGTRCTTSSRAPPPRPPQRNPQPEPSSSLVCDSQVTSSHLRPPLQQTWLPVEPTKQWLQNRTDLAPGVGPNVERHNAVDRRWRLPPHRLAGDLTQASYHYFLHGVILSSLHQGFTVA